MGKPDPGLSYIVVYHSSSVPQAQKLLVDSPPGNADDGGVCQLSAERSRMRNRGGCLYFNNHRAGDFRLYVMPAPCRQKKLMTLAATIRYLSLAFSLVFC